MDFNQSRQTCATGFISRGRGAKVGGREGSRGPHTWWWARNLLRDTSTRRASESAPPAAWCPPWRQTGSRGPGGGGGPGPEVRAPGSRWRLCTEIENGCATLGSCGPRETGRGGGVGLGGRWDRVPLLGGGGDDRRTDIVQTSHAKLIMSNNNG